MAEIEVAVDVTVDPPAMAAPDEKPTTTEPETEGVNDPEQPKKKPSGPRKPKSARSHPPFLEMITDAIVTLKEKTGSSQYAINRFIEEKYQQLPSNFRKLLLFHLNKLVAAGKIVKVKNSFKLPSDRPVVPKSASSRAKKPKVVATKAPVKPKPKAVAKANAKPKAAAANPKATAAVAKRKAAVKHKAAAKPKPVAKPTTKPAAKAARTSTRTSPGKKVAPVTKPAAPKKAPAKSAKKPKSLKSPARRGRK